MTIDEWLFIMAFLGCIGVLIANIYNVVYLGQKWDIRISVILFLGYMMSWAVGLVVFLFNAETLIYSMLFSFTSWLMVLNMALLLANIFFHIRDTTEETVKAFDSMKFYKANEISGK